jgi:hypothetical protein
MSDFEQIKAIEPSADWNSKLERRLKTSQSESADKRFAVSVLLGLVLLLAVNVFSFSNRFASKNEVQNKTQINNVISSFLISTDI